MSAFNAFASMFFGTLGVGIGLLVVTLLYLIVIGIVSVFGDKNE